MAAVQFVREIARIAVSPDMPFNSAIKVRGHCTVQATVNGIQYGIPLDTRLRIQLVLVTSFGQEPVYLTSVSWPALTFGAHLGTLLDQQLVLDIRNEKTYPAFSQSTFPGGIYGGDPGDTGTYFAGFSFAAGASGPGGSNILYVGDVLLGPGPLTVTDTGSGTPEVHHPGLIIGTPYQVLVSPANGMQYIQVSTPVNAQQFNPYILSNAIGVTDASGLIDGQDRDLFEPRGAVLPCGHAMVEAKLDNNWTNWQGGDATRATELPFSYNCVSLIIFAELVDANTGGDLSTDDYTLTCLPWSLGGLVAEYDRYVPTIDLPVMPVIGASPPPPLPPSPPVPYPPPPPPPPSNWTLTLRISNDTKPLVSPITVTVTNSMSVVVGTISVTGSGTLILSVPDDTYTITTSAGTPVPSTVVVSGANVGYNISIH